MIVAIHAIALNEEKHAERWAQYVGDADYVVVGDTGSTDRTAEILRANDVYVAHLAVRPWRFDAARNAAWALIPANVDVVVKLDLDEVLVPGWREVLEKAWEQRTQDTYRFTYRFIWSWLNGQPDVVFNADSIVSRDGWRWRSPCHETLTTTDQHEFIHVDGLTIEHHPDDEKPRSSYLDLLAVGVAEEPHDDRLAHYYARELYYRGDWNASRLEFVRHLELPTATWAAERAASLRFIAAMDDDPEKWLLRAVSEDKSRRESWVALVDYYRVAGDVESARWAARRALEIGGVNVDYMVNAHARDDEYLQALL